MPMYCPVCDHCEDSRASTCPRCGMAMRFSLLAGFISADDSKGFVKVRLGGGPTLGTRIAQFVVGTLFSHLLCVGLAFLILVFLTATHREPEEFASRHPLLFQMIVSLVILAAPVLTVAVQLFGVYLAQIMGLLIGIAASSLLCALRVQLHIPMGIGEWMVIPLCGAACFGVGLLIGGKLPVVEEFQFKPIDSWDREARPSEREIATDASVTWIRILMGIFVGWASWHGISGLLYMVFKTIIKNPTLLQASMMRVEVPLHAFGCLIAGMVAGSSSRAGAVPGMIVGFAILAMVQTFEPAATLDGVALYALITLVPAAVGGVLGRAIFKPFRIFGNARNLPAPMATTSASR